MSKIAVLPIVFSLALAVNASAALIGTMGCQDGLSSCNSESNVEGILGQDVQLVWESGGGMSASQISTFGDSQIMDPFASNAMAGSWFGGGDGNILYASTASSNTLSVYGGTSWSFPSGSWNFKFWTRPCSAIPEPSSAVVFALGFGMVSAGIRKRARRQ
jgi:hypothetical protein